MSNPDDILEQTEAMNEYYKIFRKGLSEFLGLDERNDTQSVREEPLYACKDWNDQLLRLRKQEETNRQGQNGNNEDEQKQLKGYHR